jgi:hypothetical protein
MRVCDARHWSLGVGGGGEVVCEDVDPKNTDKPHTPTRSLAPLPHRLRLSHPAVCRGVVKFDDGTSITMQRRERPHLVFDPVTGVPTHLINGVQPPAGDRRDRGGQHDQSYSIIVPLKRANLGGGGPPAPANDLFARAIKVFPANGDLTGVGRA